MAGEAPAATRRPLDGLAGHLVRRVQQRHTALWAEVVSPVVTGPQYAVLAVLAEQPGSSQRELGAALDLDASTIAGLVARLDSRGQISREPDEVDARKKTLRLTPAGETLRASLAPRVDALQDALTDALTQAEREQLRDLLHRILAD